MLPTLNKESTNVWPLNHQTSPVTTSWVPRWSNMKTTSSVSKFSKMQTRQWAMLYICQATTLQRPTKKLAFENGASNSWNAAAFLHAVCNGSTKSETSLSACYSPELPGHNQFTPKVFKHRNHTVSWCSAFVNPSLVLFPSSGNLVWYATDPTKHETKLRQILN